MSLITDVVVVAMSDEREAIAYVNKHLMAADPRGQQFAPLDMSAAGGGKVASSAVYAAAFNFVDITGLEDALRSAPWRFPDWVTVCILGETTGFERLFPGSGEPADEPDMQAPAADRLRRIADQDIGGNAPWLADELRELARAVEVDMSGPASAPPRRYSFTRDELADVISHLEARIPASGPMAGKIDAGSMADAIAEGLEQRRAAAESCHFWDIRARECRYEMLFLGCEPCKACPERN